MRHISLNRYLFVVCVDGGGWGRVCARGAAGRVEPFKSAHSRWYLICDAYCIFYSYTGRAEASKLMASTRDWRVLGLSSSLILCTNLRMYLFYVWRH